MSDPQGAVLVVDDEPDIRGLLRDTLEIAGYSVVEAANGQAALTVLRSERLPALVITDLMMPVMGGLSLVTNLRSDPRTATIPIVLLSALARQPSAAEIANLVDAVVEKPFNPRGLVAVLRAVLSRPAGGRLGASRALGST